jgi:SAM-dependent MidA family methyltransferase
VLQELISERIQREGPISFADYMHMALYEPDYGYYVTGAAKMGWEGDYYTSTDVSLLFAHCMGRQLYRMWEKLARPAHFLVLEQGAGRGDLARQIHTWAEQEAPDFFAALAYRAEDIRSRITALAPSANQEQSRPSVILSNELIDALPVHIVEKHGEQLYEVYVDLDNGRLREVLAEPTSEEVATYLDTYTIPWRTFRDGWRAEINLDALRWMERTAQLLDQGFVLTIDYGDKARALYTPQRPRGTLLCYYQHQTNEFPLRRPGEQDITAHVNFSALLREGRRHGLRLHQFTTQRLWLRENGLDEEIERIRSRDFAPAESERSSDRGQVALLRWYMLRQRIAALTDPNGMGNFKVFIQRRVSEHHRKRVHPF